MFSRLRRSLCALLVAVGSAGVAVAINPAPAHASTVGGSITASEVLARAQRWVNLGVPYSQDQSDAYSDGDGHYYRPDCSGYVAMAWHLGRKSDGWDFNTYDFNSWSGKTNVGSLNDLQPADAIISGDLSHIVIFKNWVNPADHGQGARVYSEPTYGQVAVLTTYPWSHLTSAGYRGLRYHKIVQDTDGASPDRGHADLTGDGYADLWALTTGDEQLTYTNKADGSGRSVSPPRTRASPSACCR